MSETSLTASFSLSGTLFTGTVLHINRENFTLSFDSCTDQPKPDSLVDVIHLQTIRGDIHTLQQGIIMQVTMQPEQTLLLIRTDDTASRALLWNLAYDLMHSAKDAEQKSAIEEEPVIPHRGHYGASTCSERLAWVREQTRQPLPHLGNTHLQPEQLKGNIENFIGGIQIPVGIAGPLWINGQQAQGYTFAPFATTEGALVASVCRGAKALNKSGGVHTHVLHQQMMRAPLFVTGSFAEALRLQTWILAHREEIASQVQTASRHAQLTGLEPFISGAALHVRFLYQTGDAAGQNMTTACTWKACQWILAQMPHHPSIHIRHFYIEANMSGDKKVNFLNYSNGRGIRVAAEAILIEEALQQVLKVGADELLQAYGHFMSGSLQMGMVGININIANTIAAIFAATGQDLACVHESALGQLQLQKHPQGVHASLVLPSLIIGTVGGGTGLPSQQDCLQLMGCAGTGKVNKLAEIIASFCLALDLSTLSAIVSGQFASAHEKLGRNRPEDGLKEEHLTEAFFRDIVQTKEGDTTAQLLSVEPLPIHTGNSILSDLTASQLKKKVGHFLYQVNYLHRQQPKQLKLVLKAKPTDHEVVNMLNGLAQACGGSLASLYELHKFETGFRNCSRRELDIYRITDKRFTSITPEIYKIWEEDSQEIYVVAMEYLAQTTHMNTVNNIGLWTNDDIKTVLRDLAMFHSIYLGQEEVLRANPLLHQPSGALSQRLVPLWNALLSHHVEEFPELYTKGKADIIKKAIAAIPASWIHLEKAPHTLIHHDFNLRNICLRPATAGKRLCVYDWELAAVHVPQYDVCEFLAFVLPPEAPVQTRHQYLEYYRKALEKQTSLSFDREAFLQVYNLACLDFAYNRLSLYAMAHTLKNYEFFPRVFNSHLNYVASFME
jgi:NADP-dependent 3-hydroxy-3-methylglutaryl-CoA reductase